MWIVKLALRRPYTFVVMAVLIAVLGGLAINTMQKDIFPYIDIPIVSVVWNYNGISPEEMSSRIVTPFERAISTTVNDIEHLESSSYTGVAVVRVFFQPNVKIDVAIAQITAISQPIIRIMPPGIFPPAILKYDASSVPILQLGLSSKTLSEQEIFNLSQNFIRTQLASVQGASIPLPYGGKFAQVMVDLDPKAMYANNVSASDVSNALNAQNLILPAGTAKMGDRDYFVRLNSSPTTIQGLNDLPLKVVNGSVKYIHDVAQVRDGYGVQINVVRENGRRSSLLTILRNGQASTLDIVRQIKALLPRVMASIPPALEVKPMFDQSLFVEDAIFGVAREALIAAGLTAVMILVFLGSWRSTIIVCTSIPLSILTSCIILWALGYTINAMTLGGMALAVGILVDDATVEIENVHRNMGMAKPLTRAILDGARQIAVPAFVSTLAICIVFVPVVMLTGPAKFLFTPLALAVVFAMIMSYFLSRTIVPTMMHYMLRPEVDIYARGEEGLAHAKGFVWKMHHAFNVRFERLRAKYAKALGWCLHHRARVTTVYIAFVGASLLLMAAVGTDFFPTIDSGQMRLHVRAPEGTRIEETEKVFAAVENTIRQSLPPNALDEIIDNIGLPNGGFNLAFGDSASVGTSDGEILLSLNPEARLHVADVQRQIRTVLNKNFPDEVFFFQTANITNQILNFGIPSPIDVQVTGRDQDAAWKLANLLNARLQGIPGAVDVHIRQEMNAPAIEFNIDRDKAGQAGMTQRDVANSMLISLSSSGQIAPTQWLNPANGVSYGVSVQTPQTRMDSMDALRQTPISAPGRNAQPQLFENLLSSTKRTVTSGLLNHYNVQPVFDIYANTDRRDLGGVARDIQRVLDSSAKDVPKGLEVSLRGQVETMASSFRRLSFGLVFAVLLVYLLMVVNFQSWLDPFIILTALPGAFAGILWMLYTTQTTISVPSLMGAIMAVGVATANSILVVTFANDERFEGKDHIEAALSAGVTRIRPVLMTALAMIVGMLPMALGLGEGGEQNAPLGRAVIGGLMFATFSTLFFVPMVYSFLRKKPPVNQDRVIEEEAHETLILDNRPQVAE
ncbi:MAG TPA: efflux RND transporter permease subunit [Bryobacteraceae bacterium]|nr:efflux RND transporter permease subunit [Bryobacteraceae bacterium]